MAKSSNAIKLLLQAVTFQEDLAFKMFLQDHPGAERHDFDSSPEKVRFTGYALIAITEFIPEG